MRRQFKLFVKKITSVFLFTVKAGPLQGYKVIAASGTKFIRGTYEKRMMQYLAEHLKPGDVCLDVGGHIGYISLVMGKIIGPTGNVFTLEPRPINIKYIEKHISANKADNVKLIKTGVSNYIGTARFDLDTGTGSGKITNKGILEIPVTTIDTLLESGDILPPRLIKMDIEGEEVNALKGAEKLLVEHKPLLNISTHGKEIREQCEAFLTDLGYEIQEGTPRNDLIAHHP